LENVEILDGVVIPDTDHAITERAKCSVATPVFRAFNVLASVELDDQALAANKVDIVSSNWLLADEFEAPEPPTAKARPQGELCRGE
jgi:hypothetical protein